MRAIASMKLRAVIWTAAVASVGGFCMGGIVFSDDTTDAQSTYHALPTPEPRVDQAAVLMKLHHCWSGQAPADMARKIPGHSVVTPRGLWPVYAGSKLTGEALDQLFGGKDHLLIVHGFCR